MAGTSVDSGVSSPLTLLSVMLSSGVACPETPFWSMSMGSIIVERGVLGMVDVSDTQNAVVKFSLFFSGRWVGEEGGGRESSGVSEN